MRPPFKFNKCTFKPIVSPNFIRKNLNKKKKNNRYMTNIALH